MAWLQNLAGRAEDLLNKIDKNAATVLNESNLKTQEENLEPQFQTCTIVEETEQLQTRLLQNGGSGSLKLSNTLHESPSKTSLGMLALPKADSVVDFAGIVSDDSTELLLKSTTNSIGSVKEDSLCDKITIKSDKVSSNSSIHNSFILAEETENLNEKIAKVEFENQDLNKQLLNMQHLYSQLRNENGNLQNQIERLNEQVVTAQNEKDQYIARAQRILQEKEKLISLKQESASVEEAENVFATYNEELKRELEFQQEKNSELSQKNLKLSENIQSLQMQHQIIQNGLQQSNQTLEETVLNERKLRKIAEDECQLKTKDMHSKTMEVSQLHEVINAKNVAIVQLKESLKQKNNISGSEDLESAIKSLTQTLMLKQNSLETVTTERNALRLQMEKLENEYKQKLSQMQRSQVKIVNVPELNDARPQVPQFMRVTPMDAGVTRRVKHAYSTVDAISVRTGIFLRRYPLARVFVFCYMVLLHIWVLVILFLYAPSNR